jgi:hypothetical protein
MQITGRHCLNAAIAGPNAKNAKKVGLGWLAQETMGFILVQTSEE